MKYTGIKVTNTGMCPHIPVYQRVRFPWKELKVFHDALIAVVSVFSGTKQDESESESRREEERGGGGDGE